MDLVYLIAGLFALVLLIISTLVFRKGDDKGPTYFAAFVTVVLFVLSLMEYGQKLERKDQIKIDPNQIQPLPTSKLNSQKPNSSYPY